jgi:hypothetical protein
MTPLCAATAVPARQTAHRLCTQLRWLEPQNCGPLLLSVVFGLGTLGAVELLTRFGGP